MPEHCEPPPPAAPDLPTPFPVCAWHDARPAVAMVVDTHDGTWEPACLDCAYPEIAPSSRADITGYRFGWLTITNGRNAAVEALCRCGKSCTALRIAVRKGIARSCGCVRAPRRVD